jgi:AraC-like DNA-binding protein
MPVIALLAASRPERATLADALARFNPLASMRVCARAEELARLVAAGDVAVVVADLHDADGAPTTSALLELQRRDATLPLIVAARLSPTAAGAIAQADRDGLQANWVIRDAESIRAAVRCVLIHGVQVGPGAIVLRRAVSVLRPAAHSLVAFLAIGAARPNTVEAVANVFNMTPRTLERRFQTAGLPPPHRVLGWCRLLQAAWHLDALDRTPRWVKEELRFKSVPALYNLFRHYGAPTPAMVREHKGFSDLLQRFTDELDVYRRTLLRGESVAG